MTHPLFTLQISVVTDLILLRERSRHVATGLGFDLLGQVRLAAAASRVGGEMLRHSRTGVASFALEDGPVPELVMTFHDAGPLALDGVRAALELVGRCEIASSPSGAILTFGVALLHGFPTGELRATLALDPALAAPGGLTDLVLRQNQELLETLQELTSKQGELERTSARLTASEETGKRAEASSLPGGPQQSVSLLTAGIAHHFNNLLTPIIGYANLVADELPPESAHNEYLREVIRAGEDAAQITRQLLAFGQRQSVSPRVLDLNVTARRLMASLGPMTEGRVALTFDTYAASVPVSVDETQLELVLMSIVQNAKDAMPPAGGELNICSSTVELDTTAAQRLAVPVGSYACLSFLDFGCGMGPEVVSRVFDPFFTTKSMAVASGLGLAAAHGIIRQSGGAIQVESQKGIGTSVSVYLPLVKVPAGTPQLLVPNPTVLVVDDEAMVCRFTKLVLAKRGFTVHAAASGSEALAHFARSRGKIDVAVIDVRMPEMDGHQLAERLLELAPELPVAMMSGDPSHVAGELPPGKRKPPFLHKPFAAPELLDVVRSMLT